MQSLRNGYNGLSLLLLLNMDRFLVLGAILAALSVAAHLRAI